ncbi:MAG: 3-oxoacyl-[acyl-carrier protein] reductase, partial [uncultured Acetobacteraceae bacterium]
GASGVARDRGRARHRRRRGAVGRRARLQFVPHLPGRRRAGGENGRGGAGSGRAGAGAAGRRGRPGRARAVLRRGGRRVRRPAGRAGEQRRHHRPGRAIGGHARRGLGNGDADQRARPRRVQPGGGAAHVHREGRKRRRHRQRVVPSVRTRRRGGMDTLCRQQGRGGHLHGRLGEGSRGGGHPGQRGQSRADRHRVARRGRDAGPGGAGRGERAHGPRRHRRGGGGSGAVAAVRRRRLRHRRLSAGGRRPL